MILNLINGSLHGGSSKHYGSDHIGLVGFNNTGFVIAKPAAPHASWLQERARQLPGKISGGYTNIAGGLRTAVAMQRLTRPGVLRRIWLRARGLAPCIRAAQASHGQRGHPPTKKKIE